MKHPCLLRNAQEHDYFEHLLKFQIPQIVDVTSDIIKANLKINR